MSTWLGDRALLDANRARGEAILTAIDGDFAPYAKILGNARRTEEEAAEGNAIAARLNATLQAAQAAASAAGMGGGQPLAPSDAPSPR